MVVINASQDKQVESEDSQPAVDQDVYVNEFDLSGETVTASSTATYELDLTEVGVIAVSHEINDAAVDVEFDGQINGSNQAVVSVTDTSGTDTTLSAGSIVRVVIYDY